MIGLLAAVLAVVQPALTPGVVRPLTTAEVCATKWGLDVRNVTQKDRNDVYTAYGIPVAERGLYLIDHLVPRELGGADDLRNYWPQRRAPSHRKDRIENALHRTVCAPGATLTLEAAQHLMRGWVGE